MFCYIVIFHVHIFYGDLNFIKQLYSLLFVYIIIFMNTSLEY